MRGHVARFVASLRVLRFITLSGGLFFSLPSVMRELKGWMLAKNNLVRPQPGLVAPVLRATLRSGP
jgi:hypothetical protein